MKFNVESTRRYGCAYQKVHPMHPVLLPAWQEWNTWCTESFGPAGNVWEPVLSRWYRGSGRLLFRRPADVTAFLLRWA